MDPLVGMIVRVLLVVMGAVGWASQGRAAFDPVTGYTVRGSGIVSGSMEAACTDFLASSPQGYSGYTFQYLRNNLQAVGTSGYACSFCRPGNPSCGTADGTDPIDTADTCPAGATLANGECTCDSGYTQSGQQCVSNAGCQAGRESAGTSPIGSSPALVCLGGCEATAANVTNQARKNGVQVWAGTWRETGAGCTGGVTATAGVPDAGAGTGEGLCPVGQCYGTVNGVAACLVCSAGSPATQTSTQTTTNPDGTSSTTTTTTENRGAGGVSTTTTTTTQDAQGATTGTTTSTASKPAGAGEDNPVKSFCAENPGAAICQVGQWGGSCGAFTCSGDPVQCAQARAAWASACEMTAESAARTLGEAIQAGQDPAAGDLPQAGSPTVISIPALDSAGWLGRSCPADQVISIYGGKTVTIPWSTHLCTPMQWLGVVMLMIAAAASIRIVGVW